MYKSATCRQFSSAANNCLTFPTNLSIEANRVDPDQTAPDLGPNCLSKRLLKHFSRREKQTTFVAIGALRVNQ